MGGLSLMLHPHTGWGITFDGMAILNNFLEEVQGSYVPLLSLFVLSVSPLPYWDRGASGARGSPTL